MSHVGTTGPGRCWGLGYIRSLLSDAERKNGWQMAEWLREASPHAVQHLLGHADWDAAPSGTTCPRTWPRRSGRRAA